MLKFKKKKIKITDTNQTLHLRFSKLRVMISSHYILTSKDFVFSKARKAATAFFNFY